MFAIKSKGGDCWHYGTCVVLDGNPHTGQYRNDKVIYDGSSHCNMLFVGNRVMAQKNRMMVQRITHQNQEIEERECFKLNTLVKLVQVVYTRRYTE